jgi:hypothetical protein
VTAAPDPSAAALRLREKIAAALRSSR